MNSKTSPKFTSPKFTPPQFTSPKFTPPLPDTGFTDHQVHAKHAFNSMRKQHKALLNTTVAQRIAVLKKFRDHILANREMIIESLLTECGKTRTDANIEYLGTMDWIKWVEQNAGKFLADESITTPILLLGKKSKIWHESLGVVLLITPWNYPFHTGLTQLVSAFACGNTVVYKPSEITPMVGIYEKLLAPFKLLNDSVFIAYGDGKLGQALIDQRPEKIFFTGSTRTGIAISQQAAQYLIPVDTELGGKDAMIVFNSANITRAASAAIWGAFTHSGQSCSAVERLFVQRDIYDAFVAKVTEETAKLKQGLTDDDGDLDIGRVTVDFQYDIINSHVQDAIKKGAKVVSGGQGNRDTLTFEPTVLTDVDNSMLTMSKETFGPVLPIIPFDSEADAITMANDSDYGLQASVFSNDIAQAKRVARQLEVGGVSINNVNMVEGNPWLSFGGRKQTGNGRARGVEGFLAYTRSKHILIDPNSHKLEVNWYPYTNKKYKQLVKMIDTMFQRGITSLPKTVVVGLKLEKIAQLARNHKENKA